MFQRILIPLDGSLRAEQAIPVAARLAHASHGSVILMRAVSESGGIWPSMAGRADPVQQALASELDEAERYLAEIAVSCELEGIPVESVIQLGPAVPSILEVAQASLTDLIVMCSHSYTGLTRRIMGSVAEKLAREASVPLLVLREDGPVPGEMHPEDARPLRALVPLDGSPHAKAALEPAAFLLSALAGPDRGVLHLVRVVQPTSTNLEEGGMLTATEKARRYLSATVEHIREGHVAPSVSQLNLDITWSVAVETYVADALVRAAEDARASEETNVLSGSDLIALATHGRHGLQRWVMGSVTAHVLRDTKLPLLIVPPAAQRAPIEGEQIEEVDTGGREQRRSNAFTLV